MTNVTVPEVSYLQKLHQPIEIGSGHHTQPSFSRVHYKENMCNCVSTEYTDEKCIKSIKK